MERISRTHSIFNILKACLIILFLLLPYDANAQIVGSKKSARELTDSLRHEYDSGPYFTPFKDNYFIFGGPIGHRPNRMNTNVKFQVSVMMKLTKSTLPLNSFIFLAYTQKTIWNVCQESLPMRDMNFNPAIGWAKPLFNKDRYLGKIAVMLEHESNGKAGDDSRSWNKISFSASILIEKYLMVHGKVWIPIIDSGNNKDILRYSGIWQSGISLRTKNEKFMWDLTLVKRSGWNLNFNTIFEFSWLINKKMNFYLFFQYYNGFGENLLDYNKFKSTARAGICFKPKFFSEF